MKVLGAETIIKEKDSSTEPLSPSSSSDKEHNTPTNISSDVESVNDSQEADSKESNVSGAEGSEDGTETECCHDHNYDNLDPFPEDDPGTAPGTDPADTVEPPKGPVTIDTIRQMLFEKNITIRYNQITKRPEIKGMPPEYSPENAANILPILLQDELKTQGKKVTMQAVTDALTVIMDENRFNPILDKLESTEYDGKDHIELFDNILGIKKDTLDTVYFHKWAHQCIAMALNDEEKPYGNEGVLTLQGDQGAGKTLFFRTLISDPNLFAEGVSINMDNKDSLIQATSEWVVEIGELDSTLKREQSQLKAFITCSRDTYRIPYARTAIRPVRRTSYCATVNPGEFLMDETGSRRFYVIHVRNIDKDKLLHMTDDEVWQFWKQVYDQLYLPDPQGFRLTDEERKALEARNKKYAKAMPGEIELMDHLDFSRPISEWEYHTVTDLEKRFSIYSVSAVQLGKVLAKIAREKPEVLTKNISGKKMYFLP